MDEADFRHAIQASNQDPIPRDIVLQVCLAEQGAKAVLQRLYREVEILAPLLARDRAVVRLVFEGDGLARLEASERADLLRSLAQHFSLVPNALAPEAGDFEGCDVLGLGPSAASRFGDCLALNATDPVAYCRSLDQGRLPIVEMLTNSNQRA